MRLVMLLMCKLLMLPLSLMNDEDISYMQRIKDAEQKNEEPTEELVESLNQRLFTEELHFLSNKVN